MNDIIISRALSVIIAEQKISRIWDSDASTSYEILDIENSYHKFNLYINIKILE